MPEVLDAPRHFLLFDQETGRIRVAYWEPAMVARVQNAKPQTPAEVRATKLTFETLWQVWKIGLFFGVCLAVVAFGTFLFAIALLAHSHV